LTTVLDTLSQAERMLAEARTAQEFEDIRRSAEAARVLAQQLRLGTEAINHATAIKLKAEIRLAQVVDEGQAAGEIATRGRKPPDSGALELGEIGVDQQRLAEARVLARSLDAHVVDQIVDSANEEGAVVSRNGVLHAAEEIAVARLAEDGVDIALHKRERPAPSLEEWRVAKVEAAVLTLASCPEALVAAVADAVDSLEIADRCAGIAQQIAAARRER